MTIQGALLTALSSLATEQRASMIIANNIANSQTPGFVRREMPRSEIITGDAGTGVQAEATQRAADQALAVASRQASGSEKYAQRIAEVLRNYAQTVGDPSDERSLSGTIAGFREAMATLSAAPDNAVAQSAAAASAQDLVRAFHETDASIATARADADLGIKNDVEAVNEALSELQDVEQGMRRATARGESTAEFEDRRDELLNRISDRIPIKTFRNGDAGIIVTTDQGTTLWDGRVRKIEFTHSPYIPSEVQYQANTSKGYQEGLSGITIEGKAVRSSDSGSIAAGFKLRDQVLTGFTRQVDQLAFNMAMSMQDSDASLSASDAGILTDGGNRLDGANATSMPGLARRITLNAKVDPDAAGEAWRFRDGAAATAPGASSNNLQILDFLDGLEAERTYDTSTGIPASMDVTRAASQIAGFQQGERARWEDRADIRASLALDAKSSLLNKTGVDIDEELQKLQLLQQTYAATVQVIRIAGEMLDELTRIR